LSHANRDVSVAGNAHSTADDGAHRSVRTRGPGRRVIRALRIIGGERLSARSLASTVPSCAVAMQLTIRRSAADSPEHSS
jgi:hypothetical protein